MENKKLSGVELIAEERKRQIEKEGWTAEHDAQYEFGELHRAAACYETPHEKRSYRAIGDGTYKGWMPFDWPWRDEWWKPTPNDRVRELVKAGALYEAENDREGDNNWMVKVNQIAAEIDRLQNTQP